MFHNLAGWFIGRPQQPPIQPGQPPQNDNNDQQPVQGPVQESIAERLRRIRRTQGQARVAQGAVSRWWAPNVAQSPVQAPPLNVIERGPADNAIVIGGLGGAGIALHPSILRGINIAPFAQQDIAAHAVTLDGLLTASSLTTLRLPQREARAQQLIHEMLAPYIPIDQVLTERQARDEAWQILDNINQLAGQDWFIDGLAELRRLGRVEVADRWQNGNWAQDALVAPAPNQPPIAGANIGVAQNRDAALAARLNTLEEIARVMNDRHRGRALYPILLTLVSFAMRGEITQAKLSRIQRELGAVMPAAAEHLSREDIAMTWRNFGHYVNDGTIGGVIRRWLQYIPAPAVRLRVILNQATGSGLTSLDTIARAIHLHPNFPWHMIQRLYPDDWARAIQALRIVGDNPYFGYRGNLGEVRAALYKPIAWICGRLLIVGGDTTLGEYRGFQPDARYRDLIEELITGYYQSLDVPDIASDPTPEEYAAFEDLLTLVANHPANSGAEAV